MTAYRQAESADCEAIAALHAERWRQTYRGVLSDTYLNNEVGEDRLAVWQKRFSEPADNQYVILAEEGQKLVGFISFYPNSDPDLGTLIDNLHVDAALTGRGIGAALLREGVRQVMPLAGQPGFYLYVYEANVPAIRFYERMGGICVNRDLYEPPGGGQAMALCYMWDDL